MIISFLYTSYNIFFWWNSLRRELELDRMQTSLYNLQLSAYSSPIHRRRRRRLTGGGEKFERKLPPIHIVLSSERCLWRKNVVEESAHSGIGGGQIIFFRLFFLILALAYECEIWNLYAFFFSLFRSLLWRALSHWIWVELSSFHSWPLETWNLLFFFRALKKSARFHPRKRVSAPSTHISGIQPFFSIEL